MKKIEIKTEGQKGVSEDQVASVREAWLKQLERRDTVLDYLQQPEVRGRVNRIVSELRKSVSPDNIGELLRDILTPQFCEQIPVEEAQAGASARMMGTLYSLDRLMIEAYLLSLAAGAHKPVECVEETLEKLEAGLSDFVRQIALESASAFVAETRYRKKADEELSRLSQSESKSRNIITDLTNQNRRLMEDYSSLRKRTDKMKDDVQATAAVAIIRSLLPVMENFHHATTQKDIQPEAAPYMQGMYLIEKGMWDVLADAGLAAIDQEGIPFDPERHEAVVTEADKNVEEDMVLEILSPGYAFKDKVIKHARVRVAVPEEENKA